jgi:hypothetical protein
MRRSSHFFFRAEACGRHSSVWFRHERCSLPRKGLWLGAVVRGLARFVLYNTRDNEHVKRFCTFDEEWKEYRTEQLTLCKKNKRVQPIGGFGA